MVVSRRRAAATAPNSSGIDRAERASDLIDIREREVKSSLRGKRS
jgi:hypothetical protein